MFSVLSIKQVLHMGRYAAYVWSAYGIVLGALLLQVFYIKSHFRKTYRAKINQKSESYAQRT